MGKWWEGGNKSLLSKSYTYQNWFWRFGKGRQLLLCVLGAAEAMERVAVCKRTPQPCPRLTQSLISQDPEVTQDHEPSAPLSSVFLPGRAHTHILPTPPP